MHDEARTISIGDIKLDWRRMGIEGLNGVCHVSKQRDVLKRHSLAFLLSLWSCFFRLDFLFWHGLASLNLAISPQHHYSAQIDFDMHEFKLFLFIHALRYHQNIAVAEILVCSCLFLACFIEIVKMDLGKKKRNRTQLTASHSSIFGVRTVVVVPTVRSARSKVRLRTVALDIIEENWARSLTEVSLRKSCSTISWES